MFNNTEIRRECLLQADGRKMTDTGKERINGDKTILIMRLD